MSHSVLCVFLDDDSSSCDCDGYHTWEELYEHRNQLFLALCRHVGGWRSRKHHDGTMYQGWFIVGINNQDMEQITYYIPDRLWASTGDLNTLDAAPELDGHTSQIVIERLKAM